jgi:hydroxymethylglutaryl-CoA lyase
MVLTSCLPTNIRLMEVGPRDGLQNEAQLLDTKNKIAFIESLADAGFKRIEVTAFVSPTWIPQLADHVEVANGIKRRPGVSYAALVPNVRGYEKAFSSNIDEISVVVAASDTHNQKNLNGDTKKVMERYQELLARARKDNCPFRAYISCAFACPYEGPTDPKKVLSLSQDLLSMGAYEIAISDTIGVATPIETMKLLELHLKSIAKDKLALHMHDTYGRALANIFAALTLGISSFDAAAGGLGGCPYALGASGNVASEDLISMLESMGLKTGVSLDKLSKTTLSLEKLLGKQVPSKIVAACRKRA